MYPWKVLWSYELQNGSPHSFFLINKKLAPFSPPKVWIRWTYLLLAAKCATFACHWVRDYVTDIFCKNCCDRIKTVGTVIKKKCGSVEKKITRMWKLLWPLIVMSLIESEQRAFNMLCPRCPSCQCTFLTNETCCAFFSIKHVLGGCPRGFFHIHTSFSSSDHDLNMVGNWHPRYVLWGIRISATRWHWLNFASFNSFFIMNFFHGGIFKGRFLFNFN